MRVFTAIDIEDREILLELEKMQSELDFNFNLVEPEKMHITLQFFQDVDDKEVEEIIDAMKNIETEPFSLGIKGAGVFPSKNHIRVVWAGVESEEVFELKKQVSDHEVEEANHHEFQPHVTLARVDSISRTQKKDFRQKLEELENKEIGSLEADSVKLFESIPTAEGNKYRVLEKVKL